MLNIDSAFLKQERRCDFLVTTTRKKVWQKEIDCFKQFLRICEKHNLRYFLCGGSLLGAIRHGGFIPWDDDMDVSMFRDDYEVFLKVAKTELNKPYMLQASGEDGEFYCGFARIRDSETTALLPGQWSKKTKMNHGIFIDIFPMDSVPDNKAEKIIHRCIGKLLSVASNSKIFDLKNHPENIGKLGIWLVRLVLRIVPGRKVAKLRDRWISRYNGTGQRQVGLISMFYNMERWIWNKADFDECTYIPFEYVTASIPVGYENILRKTYGNWQKLVRNASMHSEILFDTERPFTYYINRYDEFKDRITPL